MTVVAAIQMTTGADVAAQPRRRVAAAARGACAGRRNRRAARELRAHGPQRAADKLAIAEAAGDGPIQRVPRPGRARVRHVDRRRHRPDRAPRMPRRSRRRAWSSTMRGRTVARYDKIHLFDVDIPGREERYRESGTVQPGRAGRVRRYAGRPSRSRGVLRRALSRAVPRARQRRRGLVLPALGIHGADRPGALGGAAARASHRESLLRGGAGAVRLPRKRPRNLRRFDDRRLLGTGADAGCRAAPAL